MKQMLERLCEIRVDLGRQPWNDDSRLNGDRLSVRSKDEGGGGGEVAVKSRILINKKRKI